MSKVVAFPNARMAELRLAVREAWREYLATANEARMLDAEGANRFREAQAKLLESKRQLFYCK